MKNETVGERIQALRKLKKLSQVALARAVGVSNVAISQWERSETEPRGDNLMSLAAALSCSPSHLLYGEVSDRNVSYVAPYKAGNRYPVISSIQAGAWAEACEPYTLKDIDQWLESDAHIQGEAFWLKVEGDSMTAPVGLSIPEGTFVLFDTGRDPVNGSLVIAKLIEDNEATFKKLVIDGSKKFLRGLNPHWPMVPINGNCKIIGVAVETKMRLV
ncbi:LexA family protein [Serratia marcescens]|uniref:Helix-turn-helix domain-containing protein n=1 Tax=Serratia marcescens TaxID=615 RepID=A0A9X8YNQ8_SERMA|nr:S24 family peptidase [Serratia marcescens]MBS3895115.1 helix-turn-helix domain-containing protein [Serratia marcescens]